MHLIFLRAFPDRPFRNFRASKSVDRSTFLSYINIVHSTDFYCFEMAQGSFVKRVCQLPGVFFSELNSPAAKATPRNLGEKETSRQIKIVTLKHFWITTKNTLAKNANIQMSIISNYKYDCRIFAYNVFTLSGWSIDGNTSYRAITEVKHLGLNQSSDG